MLQNELARIRPTIGDTLGIRYGGQKVAASGRSKYHSYRVRGSGGSAGVNWGRYGEPDGEPSQPTNPVTAANPVDPAEGRVAELTSRYGDTMPDGDWEDE